MRGENKGRDADNWYTCVDCGVASGPDDGSEPDYSRAYRRCDGCAAVSLELERGDVPVAQGGSF